MKTNDSLHYFSSKEKEGQDVFSKKRTTFLKPISASLTKIGVSPDQISYFGIFLLILFGIFFKSAPILAFVLLFFYVVMDGIDGSLARFQNTQNKGGSLTDIICDQLGLVVIAGLLIYYNMASPLLGYIYVTIYLTMIVLSVYQNALNIKLGLLIRSKYYIYILSGLFEINSKYNIVSISSTDYYNYYNYFFILFSVIMTITSLKSYVEIKRHFNKVKE